MNRRDLIRNRLSSHLLEEQRCAVVCPPKEAILRMPIAGHLFGWFPPMPLEDSRMLLVSFCPELMAEITAWLDDEQLDAYLWTIEALLDEYISMMTTCDELLTNAELRDRVEAKLLDAEPDALELLSQIELRALDTGIVTRPTPA